MHSLVLFIWFVACAVQDVRHRQIANTLTLGAALLALIYLLWSAQTWLGAEASQGGWAFLLALAFTLPGYAMGRLGAADAKLLAALGLATDVNHLLGTFIGAGLVSALWLLIAPRLWPHMGQRLRQALHLMAPEMSKKQPFAPFLLAGFFLTWLCLR